jgi:hypothetical protein
MSEKTTCPSKCIWSRLFTGVFAFVLLAAVPVLAVLVLGADVYSLVPAEEEPVQSPLTWDVPTTNLLKLKPAPNTGTLALANADAVLLSKWKYSFDLSTALELGGAGSTASSSGPSTTTLELTLLVALFALQDNLLASASPTLAPMLLTLFTQQNTILAELLGLPTTGF